ncbi:hypothetical protein BY996DRAFT_6455729 [Phakopsora pachyrhizi]|nr:hypothetical protein BY996DRAFT_6455729 [Phakopsora pachyrhizi]
MPLKKDRRKKGRNRWKGDVEIAGPTTYRRADNVKRCAILQGQQRKGTMAGPTKARMRFGGIKIAGGRPEEVSVGLVRRQETPLSKTKRRTDIGGISEAVVGRAVLSDFDIGRRRHTEVRSSYHFGH